MHHPMEKLVFVSYSLTQLVTSTPLRPVGKPDSISAGTGITYPGGYNIPASSDIRSIMRKIANYDTPLLEGDCSPVEVPSAIKVVPDTPEAFQSFKGWRVGSNLSLYIQPRTNQNRIRPIVPRHQKSILLSIPIWTRLSIPHKRVLSVERH